MMIDGLVARDVLQPQRLYNHVTADVLCLQFFYLSDYSRLWFIYLIIFI